MGSPRTKIAQARAATAAAAVDVIRDGVAFAVIAGNTGARPVFPSDGSLVIATPPPGTRRSRRWPGCGRAGGRRSGSGCGWRSRCSGTHPATLRHAILLTDGKNQHENPAQLDDAIRLCEGRLLGIGRGGRVSRRSAQFADLGVPPPLGPPPGGRSCRRPAG